jgi:hypothetical protein
MPGLVDRWRARRENLNSRRRKRHADRHVRDAHKLAAEAEARRSDTVGRGGGGTFGGAGTGGGF